MISKELQSTMTPDEALKRLKEGNQRFVNNVHANCDYREEVKTTAQGQYPFATILSCIDSRTSSVLIFDQSIGDIFVTRIAGNVVNPDILGSLEYAVKYAGAKLILVLGHTKCGAVTSACNHVQDGNITGLLDKIQPAVERAKGLENELDYVDRVAALNVDEAVARIRNESAIIRQLELEGKVKLLGAMYDIATGKVEFEEIDVEAAT
ncbi:MAG: carbonic anhydrase [Flavobacteriales bacterium]|nr:MAG: carbonic anhydrase [Flavobacteriales bacterium]